MGKIECVEYGESGEAWAMGEKRRKGPTDAVWAVARRCHRSHRRRATESTLLECPDARIQRPVSPARPARLAHRNSAVLYVTAARVPGIAQRERS